MKNNKIIVTLLVIIIVLLIGILGFGGYKYMELQKNNDKLTSENKNITEELNKQKEEIESLKQDSTSEQINNNSESHKDLFLNVLEGKQKYINESNKEVYISEFGNSDWNISVPNEGKVKEYAMVDMDGDGAEELVAIISGYDEFVLILHYQDGNIYGFADGHRALTQLKTNGYYYASCGAACGSVYQMTFNKNSKTNKELSYSDGESYRLNNKKTSKSEYDKFMNEFNGYSDVNWIKY